MSIRHLDALFSPASRPLLALFRGLDRGLDSAPASARGTQRIFGTVLRINRGMLELARSLGFQETTNSSDSGDMETRAVSLDLQTPAGPPP